jgi:tetratricopeptide (TPR) repeat protein
MVAEALSYAGKDAEVTVWGERSRGYLVAGSPAWWRMMQVTAIGHARAESVSQLGSVAELMIEQSRAPTVRPEQVIALAFVGAEAYRLQPEIGGRVLDALEGLNLAGVQGRPAGCVECSRSVRAYARGNLSGAMRHARASLSAFQQAGSDRDVAGALVDIGWFLLELGACDESERYLRESLRAHGSLSPSRYTTVQNLGVIALRRGQWEVAAQELREAADGFARAELDYAESYSLSHLALAQLALGQLEDAHRSVDRAARATADAGASAYARAVSAKLGLLRGEHEHALQLAEAAKRLLDSHALFECVAFIRLGWIECLLANQQHDQAQAALREALAWLMARAEHIDDPALRTTFLEQIPEHARLRALAGGRPCENLA